MQVAVERSRVARHEEVHDHELALPLEPRRHQGRDPLGHRVHRRQGASLVPDREIDRRRDVQEEQSYRDRCSPIVFFSPSRSGEVREGWAATTTTSTFALARRRRRTGDEGGNGPPCVGVSDRQHREEEAELLVGAGAVVHCRESRIRCAW